jgi:hypothetical protein
MNTSEKIRFYGNVAVCVVVYFSFVILPYAL